jgi:hypothetical protein
MADRHSLIRALERGGMAPLAAEEIATEIIDIVHDNVATKSDLAIAVRDVKIWTGSLAAILFGLLSGVMALFHFLGGKSP